MRLTHALACLALFATSASAVAQVATDPREARRHYDVAEKLYNQAAYEPALAEYLTSYKLDPSKRSPLRNAADCQRKLNRFADAYETYALLLQTHGPKLKPAERKAIAQEMSELAQLTGTIDVSTGEAGAEVTIDGAVVGTVPLPAPKRVGIAKHRVRIAKAGFLPVEVEVEVASLGAVKVPGDLKPEPVAGHLAVREQAGRAVHVKLDGVDVGPAPWEGDVVPGEHVIELVGEHLATERRAVSVPKKESVALVLAAESLVGHLRITASPATAAISIDGKPVGNGVWEADVDPGVHLVDVEIGTAHAHREITIHKGEVVAQEIPLEVVSNQPVFPGWYGGVALGFLYWPTAPTFSPAGGKSGASVTTGSPPIGASLDVRVGYAFGLSAVEVVGTFMILHAEDHLALSGTSIAGSMTNYKIDWWGPSGFFGAGYRLATTTDPARFTFGIAPGAMVRGVQFDDDYQCQATACARTTPNNIPLKVWAAPGFHADIGLLAGSTPGAKFVLGFDVWADFPSTQTVGPDTQAPTGVYPSTKNKNLVVVQTPEVVFGPTLGVRWGH